MPRVLRPAGEARDDHAILGQLARRLGCEEQFTEGRDAERWLRHLYDRFRDRWIERDVALPGFDEFWAAGEVRLPDGPASHTAFASFRADPDGHPLRTPSGRIELYSATIAAMSHADCPGWPVWIEPTERLGRAAAHAPLALVANQPDRRLHSQHDGGAHSRAGKVAGREAVRIHPDDAARRGITDGDIVRLHNERGACLAGAVVTDSVATGVVRLPTGAWFTPVETAEGVVCAQGNPNVLTADRGTSSLAQGCTGQLAMVEVERWRHEAPDVDPYAPPLEHR